MSNDVSLQDLFGDVISSYSRAQAIADGESEIVYEMRCVTKSTRPSRVFLKLTVGPGDDGSAVFTIMLPEED